MHHTRTLLLFALFAVFAIGCGGDGPESPSNSRDRGNANADADGDVETEADADGEGDNENHGDNERDAHQGTLAITVQGLPEEAWPELTVTGLGGHFTVNSSGILHLDPGSYSLRAATYIDGLSTFEADNQTVTVTVTADDTVSVTVDYSVIPASLEIVISGLPDHLDANVELRSDGADPIAITESTELTGLPPAAYQVRASVVQDDHIWYEAENKSIDLASGDDETVIVIYDVIPGALKANVAGLPAGSPPELTITGPDGFETTSAPNTPVEGLQPGEYTVAGAPVDDGGILYTAEPETIQVSSVTTAELTLSYSIVPGAIQVAATGHPSNRTPQITITGPNDFETTVQPGALVEDLLPGEYSVAGAQISVGGTIYRALPVTVDVFSVDATNVTISYEIIAGALQLTTNGHPAQYSPTLDVSGPNDFQTTASPGSLLQDLLPGEYQVSGSQVGSGGILYRAAPGFTQVNSEQTSTLAIAYQIVPGDLQVNIEGLPAHLDANVVVTDPGNQPTSLTSTTTLTDQLPGSHTITAHDVVDGLFIYRASSATNFVRSDETVSTTITYEALPGDLSVSGSGLPYDLEYTFAIEGPSYPTATTFTNDAYLADLIPGTYTLTFEEVQQTFNTYHNWAADQYDAHFLPSPASLTVDVSSDNVADAAVTYEGVPGTLYLTYSLPDQGSLTLVGSHPNNTVEFTISGTGVKAIEFPPGDYQLEIIENNLEPDQYDNARYLTNLDEPVILSSGAEVHRSTEAPLPTLVWATEDGVQGSLREVIGRVKQSSRVIIDESISEIHLDSAITPERSISVRGDGPDAVTITTSGSDRLFHVLHGRGFTLEGLRLANVENNLDGSVILSQGALRLIDVVVEDNTSLSTEEGGIIHIDTTTLFPIQFEESRFLNNHSLGSGGVFHIANADDYIEFDRVEFTGNSAEGAGGAIYSTQALRISDAIFSNNTSHTSRGGAISMEGPGTSSTSALIRRTLFSNNSAETLGGAVYSNETTYTQNNTFFGNVAGEEGGAIYQLFRYFLAEYSTFVDNQAPIGSAVSVSMDTGPLYQGFRRFFAYSSVFIGDQPLFRELESDTQRMRSYGNNYLAHSTESFISADSDQIGTLADPLPNPFLPLADNGGFSPTMAVAPGFEEDLNLLSIYCFDYIFGNDVITHDQRGMERPYHFTCTRGAYQISDPDTPNIYLEPGYDPFDGHGLASAYAYDSTITTDAGYTWDLDGVRHENDFPIDGEGLMLREDGSSIASVGLTGAVESISVQYRKAHTGSNARRLAIAVNGEIVARSSYFGGYSGYESTVRTLSVHDLNIVGEYTIEIINISGSSSSQIVIDNLTWNEP